MENKVCDLRSAIELLKTLPGQYFETDAEADPVYEIPGVHRRIGCLGTVIRPTKEGPALVFNNVKGYPGTRLTIGMLASRKRVGHLLDCKPDRLGHLLRDSVANPVPPILVGKEKAVCQEVVHMADDPDFDIRKLLPGTKVTTDDAGQYITMGLCRASDPDTGISDVTIHRMCIQGDKRDEITFWSAPGARHIGGFFDKMERQGKALPISISIGLDPAVYIGSCFLSPTTPEGYDELGVAGAIRKAPVEVVPCLTIPETAIANAEFVIEGEILPNRRVMEDNVSGLGMAMPEFPGYNGVAINACVLKIKAITHRKDPIWQTCVGASEEHVSMAGITTEACILDMVEKSMPGRLLNVYSHPSGGGKYLVILQFKKNMPSDEGRQRQAALLAFCSFIELKHVIVVDEDVDLFDTTDVLWAMNTRFQGDLDAVTIPGVRCHLADPSADKDYNPYIRSHGISCKTIFDCTVPYDLKKDFRFIRAKFEDVDLKKFGLED